MIDYNEVYPLLLLQESAILRGSRCTEEDQSLTGW